MIARRYAGLLVAAVGALTVSGCSTFQGNDAAATVDGVEISRDDLEATLAVLAANSEATGVTEDLETGSVPGEVARGILEALVTAVASERFLADGGEAVTAADREATLAGVGESDPLRALPTSVFDSIVDLQSARAARGRLGAATAQERYEGSPADRGVVCLSHILVDTEAEAEEIIRELEAGADFAELAASRSSEPAAAQTGGALSDPQTGQPCIPLDAAEQGLDADFLAGALAAEPGVPTEPVQTSFGWHVILARPYDEVAESVAAVHGDQLFAEYLATVDVSVDPRYGRWDPETASVVAL